MPLKQGRTLRRVLRKALERDHYQQKQSESRRFGV
jgi:hypothetical protein